MVENREKLRGKMFWCYEASMMEWCLWVVHDWVF